MLTLTLATVRRFFGAGRGTDNDDDDAWAPTAFERGAAPAGDLIYRLKSWPELPEIGRTADIYRIFSVMSQRPVSRHWILARSRMAPGQLDHLLLMLESEGVLEVIDPARFAGREALQA
ncbi:MAG: hypothetical protein JWP65_2384 [Ramlibacter sp.]|jgi:hypothetical protein|uniref:DprA-like winged helix domain-containing protein n=1 Tax=Ramlibacter sp. TaxID=1917967 RepID=UPI002620EFF8|nr:hypothetical protein [Ramlibacter sp.]MDB5751963.1 hypothetical protein [Ramlibacter sp.]